MVGTLLIWHCVLTDQARCEVSRRKQEAQGKGAWCCVLTGFQDLHKHALVTLLGT